MIEALSLAASPTHWALLLAIVVAVFAPRILPLAGRLLGLLAKRMLATRPKAASGPTQLRLALPASARPAPARDAEAEAVRPINPIRAARHRRHVWQVTAVVGLAGAVLSWLLLRTR